MFLKIRNKILNLSIFEIFLTLLIINIILIGLAIIFYGDKYLFWEYPFSYAGTAKTVLGANNIISSYFYSASMVLSGLIMFILSYRFYQNKGERKDFILAVVGFVCGGGFLIAGFNPDDTRHNFHVLGSALFVSSLWIFATNFTFEVRKRWGSFKHFLVQAVLQIPIFTYAGLFFADSEPAASITQKFALLGVIIAMLYSAYQINANPVSNV